MAKRVICLSNLKQLTLAWMIYADNNNGKIVNGAPNAPPPDRLAEAICPDCTRHTKAVEPTSGGHAGEIPWIGPAWGGFESGPSPLPKEEQKCAIESGALWKYLRNPKSYRCLTGEKDEMITYIVVDGANGLNEGRGGGITSAEWPKTIGQIKKSALKLVFIDEGRLTPDSYAVNFSNGGWHDPGQTWFDPPMVRHGDGTTLSFADGHADYKKWSKPTVDYGRKPAGDFPTTGSPESAYQDLYWMQFRCWGRIGYTPSITPKVD
jgi:prepilin-type processing-associated H-X9-DG protein